jgi:hypothetical protein
MPLVRGSLLALAVLSLACTAAPSSGPPDASSASPSESSSAEPSANTLTDNPASPTPESSPPPREEPAVVASPSTPTPRASIEAPPPSPSGTPEDSVQVKGLLIHPDRTPAKDVCIIVGPQAIRCAAVSGTDGEFSVSLPQRYAVTWTVRYFVNGQEQGHQSIAGPFAEKSVQLPAFSIP